MLKGADDGHFLPVAKGQLLHLPVRGQLQPLAQPGCLLPAIGISQISGQLQHIPHPHAGVEHRLGRQIAHLGQDLLPVVPDIHAQDPGFAAGGGDQTQQGTDGGGFSCSVGADEAEEFTLRYGQVQFNNATGLAVILGQALCFDRMHIHSSFFT